MSFSKLLCINIYSESCDADNRDIARNKCVAPANFSRDENCSREGDTADDENFAAFFNQISPRDRERNRDTFAAGNLEIKPVSGGGILIEFGMCEIRLAFTCLRCGST